MRSSRFLSILAAGALALSACQKAEQTPGPADGSVLPPDIRDAVQCSAQPHLAWCQAACTAEPSRRWCNVER